MGLKRKRLTVNVTARDIERGRGKFPRCPIALALHRLSGFRRALVGAGSISLSNRLEPRLPQIAKYIREAHQKARGEI